ncbi:MAG: diguanylate cyclase, partial [Raoultibacter sp.]
MWNYTAEIIAFTIACIILAYSRKSYLTPSLKNRIFQACLIITVFAIGLNIASSILIDNGIPEITNITWLITTLYFVFTPLMSAAYFYYIYATISEAYPQKKIIATLGTIPYLLYFVCVLLNPFTNWIFYLDASGGYHQGPLVLSTYIVFYVYCLACFGLAFSSRNVVDPAITKILTTFPLVAIVVIVIQQIFPYYILSGSAAVCSLLIVYLYLQNKQISIDFLTRIPNRQEFSKMLALEKKRQAPISIVIVSVNNFKFVNDKFGSDSGDSFLCSFASYLSSIAKTPWLYRYSGDQFAALFEKSHRHEIDGFLKAIQERMDEPWP